MSKEKEKKDLTKEELEIFEILDDGGSAFKTYQWMRKMSKILAKREIDCSLEAYGKGCEDTEKNL